MNKNILAGTVLVLCNIALSNEPVIESISQKTRMIKNCDLMNGDFKCVSSPETITTFNLSMISCYAYDKDSFKFEIREEYKNLEFPKESDTELVVKIKVPQQSVFCMTETKRTFYSVDTDLLETGIDYVFGNPSRINTNY